MNKEVGCPEERFLMQAQKYFSKGQFEKTIEILERGIVFAKNQKGQDKNILLVLFLWHKGFYFELMGKYSHSINEHKKCLQISKSLKNTHFVVSSYQGLSNCYYKMRKLNIALRYAKKAVKYNKDRKNYSPLYYLGMIQYRMKNYRSAIKIFKSILRFNPDVLGVKIALWDTLLESKE